MTMFVAPTHRQCNFGDTSRTERPFALEQGRQFNCKATAAVA